LDICHAADLEDLALLATGFLSKELASAATCATRLCTQIKRTPIHNALRIDLNQGTGLASYRCAPISVATARVLHSYFCCIVLNDKTAAGLNRMLELDKLSSIPNADLAARSSIPKRYCPFALV
jgi:hypothetical protein